MNYLYTIIFFISLLSQNVKLYQYLPTDFYKTNGFNHVFFLGLWKYYRNKVIHKIVDLSKILHSNQLCGMIRVIRAWFQDRAITHHYICLKKTKWNDYFRKGTNIKCSGKGFWNKSRGSGTWDSRVQGARAQRVNSYQILKTF